MHRHRHFLKLLPMLLSSSRNKFCDTNIIKWWFNTANHGSTSIQTPSRGACCHGVVHSTAGSCFMHSHTHEVSSLFSINAHNVCIYHLQRPRIACLFDSIKPSQPVTVSIPSTLHIQHLHHFSQLLLNHWLHMSKPLHNLSIHSPI